MKRALLFLLFAIACQNKASNEQRPQARPEAPLPTPIPAEPALGPSEPEEFPAARPVEEAEGAEIIVGDFDDVVEDKKELPECDGRREGLSIFVVKDGRVYTCEDGKFRHR